MVRPRAAGRARPHRSAEPAPATSPAATPSQLRWDHAAALLVVTWGLAILWTTLAWHPTPFYSAESDTVGEYIPAAASLRLGQLEPARYQFKGIGYPAALAAASLLTGNDYYLAARLLNVVCGTLGAALAFLLFRAFLGSPAGWFVLAGLLLNPLYARMTIESGTDVPTFALLMAATWLLLCGRRPGASLLSGLVAGGAVVTRYNALFLPVAGAAVLLLRRQALPVLGGADAGPAPYPTRDRMAHLAAYLGGLAVPLGIWFLLARSAGADPWGGQNARNMAYDVYGAGLTPEEFWSTTGARFHSFREVVSYRPAAFAARIGANLARHWLSDARELLPVWLGALALPGMVVGWWRRPGWQAMALHAALCYAVLALVFYLPRFGIYLLPFYLTGAVLLLRRWSGTPPEQRSRRTAMLARLGAATLVALLLASGVSAVAGIRSALRDAPHETRTAGLLLRRLAHPGDRVMARKPNVAFFAGMEYVPLPDVTVLGYASFLSAARSAGVRYLLVSPAEVATRPQLAMLSDTAVALPGLRRIACGQLGTEGFYVLYEFTPVPAEPALFQEAVITGLRGYVARHAGQAWSHTQLAGQLLAARRYREALTELQVAERLDPRDLVTARMQIHAHERLGEYEEEAAACRRAIGLESPDGWDRARLGWARVLQGRFLEAVAALDEALRLEPGNLEYAFRLGLALEGSGDTAAAIGRFRSVLERDPGHPGASLELTRALRRQRESSDTSRPGGVEKAVRAGRGADRYQPTSRRP